MPEKLFEELAQLEQVEAVVLGGSRAGEHYDQDSDYDVYVYLKAPIDPEIREKTTRQVLFVYGNPKSILGIGR